MLKYARFTDTSIDAKSCLAELPAYIYLNGKIDCTIYWMDMTYAYHRVAEVFPNALTINGCHPTSDTCSLKLSSGSSNYRYVGITQWTITTSVLLWSDSFLQRPQNLPVSQFNTTVFTLSLHWFALYAKIVTCKKSSHVINASYDDIFLKWRLRANVVYTYWTGHYARDRWRVTFIVHSKYNSFEIFLLT